MIELYKYSADGENYDPIEVVDLDVPGQVRLHRDFRTGRRLVSSWQPLNVHVFRTTGKTSDFPAIPSIAVFSARALTFLRPLLGESIESLPLKHPDGEFYAINPLEVVDILDHGRSKFSRLPDGSVLMVEEYAFDTSKVAGHHFVSLPFTLGGQRFVSGEFRRLVEKHHLTGLRWDKRVF